MKRRACGLGLFCALLAAVASCAETTVTVEPDGKALSASVGAIVQLPVALGYGLPGEQKRVQRRTGDVLMALAAGHVILPEELPLREERDLTDKEIADAVRALGEDPARTLTFAVMASRAKRKVANGSAIPGFQLGYRLVVDYTVRLEVRQAGRSDVLGTVDGVSAAPPNEADLGARGESLGVQKAIEQAVAKAVHAFAPALESRAAQPLIAEVPQQVAGDPMKRLLAVQELYPELSLDQIQTLAGSPERFMVVQPGPWAALGLNAGDLLAGPPGTPLGSRAALARAAARGEPLLLVVARGGRRYLLAERGRATSVASAK